MAEVATTVNLDRTDAATVEVFDAAMVPIELWGEMQQVHREALRADLPKDKWEQADVLVRQGDLPGYVVSRVDPNTMVGREWNSDQFFRGPQVALTYDAAGAVVSGVLMADNTSANKRYPEPVRPLIYHTRMWLPPGLSLPTRIGAELTGRRYVHLRETYAHPEAQARQQLEPGGEEVSGLILMGLYHGLKTRHAAQKMTAYVFPADPADRTLVNVAASLEMQTTGSQPHNITGYEKTEDIVAVRTGVRDARKRIRDLFSAASGRPLDYDRARFTTKKTIEEARRARRHYDKWRIHEVTYEKGGK